MDKNSTNTSKDTIKKYLINKQQQIEEQLETIEREDPVLADATIIAASELGTDAWEAEAHAKMVVIRNNLLHLLEEINISLFRLKEGTYGECKKCGRQIEVERLQVMPTATACALCLTLT